MASEIWNDLKSRRDATLASVRDATIAGFWQTFGLHGFGAAARERLMLRKATDEMHRLWDAASGEDHLRPTPQNVSGFIQDTFDLPFEMSDDAEGNTLTRAQRERIFTEVSKILISQGRFELR